MAKMREVKVTRPGATKLAKNKPVANNSYITADGIKVTICKPVPNPKQITARG